MRCFNHQQNDAIAVCLACGKACCKQCIHDTEPMISCSAECQQTIDESTEVMNRTKIIYGIGQFKTNRPVFNSQTIFLLTTGLFFLCFVFYSWNKHGFRDSTYLLLGIGLIFTGLGVFTLIRNLKIKMRV